MSANSSIRGLIEVSIEKIQPLHPPRKGTGKVEEIAASMQRSGRWEGRPLLVEDWNEKYFAWTGSNRLAAARLATLSRIPVVLVDTVALGDQGYLRDSASNAYAPRFDSDEDRLAALRAAGDVGAAELMLEEIEQRALARASTNQHPA